MAIATQKILVIKTSSLGDIMHGLQLAQTLKENDPGIEITWVARSRFEPLVRASSAVDKTMTFYRAGGVSGFASLCGRLRQRQFDVVLDLQGLARSGLMTFFSKAPRKIGRSDAREGATLFYKELIPMPIGVDPAHPVDILLEFCRVFGFETKLRGSVEFTMGGSTEFTRSGNQPLVTIFPEGRRPGMAWAGFEGLAARLLERNPSLQIKALGTRNIDWASRLQNDFGSRVTLACTTDPLRMAGHLQHSDLLVANDSDAIHMAAAIGIGTVGLYGPTNGNKIGPYPLSESRNCALNAPLGELSKLNLDKVLDEVERRL